MQCSLCFIEFRTSTFLEDCFVGTHPLHSFEITPQNIEWNYSILSCFINNFYQFKKDDNHPFITGVTGKDYHTKFIFRSIAFPQAYFVIQIGCKISVHANIDFIRLYFTEHESFYHSFLAGWNRIRKNLKYQKHIFFNYYIQNPNDGTRYLFLHKPLVFLYSTRFFKYFCKKIQLSELPINDDTFSIREFIEEFIPTKKEKTINSLELLKQNLNGFLHLIIQKSPIKKRLAKISYQGEKYYVIGGIFVLPFSNSILTDNSEIVNGLLLDTTWRVLPYYVTSILMASSMNGGLPLSFSFGFSENVEIYQNHFNAFQNLFHIDLKQYTFESDQGPALKSLFLDNHIQHVFCFRHLMVNLKLNPISFALNVILKCTTLFELNNAFIHYSKIFSEITDQNLITLRDKLLKKVGLIFTDNTIIINDQKKWEKIALIERINLNMPSTTNSLESCHGHLNQKTKRRKNFWSSLYDVSARLLHKIHNFQKEIEHNFYYNKRKTFNHLNALLLGNRINQEITFYNTTVDSCRCSENKLLSSNFHLDIPCCHRIFLGFEFPDCPQIKLNLNSQPSELIVDYVTIQSETRTQQYQSIETQDKNFAIDMIKRFGHIKEKDREKIVQYVNTHYQIQDKEIFINGRPSSILTLIHNGIIHLHQTIA